jgi:flagellar basal-body rod protein FlgB
MALLDSPTSALVRLALDASSLRHLALANNIANGDSPNYAPQRVDFEQQLAQVRAQLAANRSAQHADFSAVRPTLMTDAPRGSGSAVQFVDQELVKVAQNTLQYQALLRASSRYGSIMSIAVNEGRN